MTNQLAIEYVPIATLIPYARNAMIHTDAQIVEIAESIDEFGWTMPVLIDAVNCLVAGHGRVLAALLRKIELIPCIRRSDWTDAQVRAYRIADNQLARKAGWNMQALQFEIQDLKTLDVNLKVLGFEPTALAAFVAGTATSWASDIERAAGVVEGVDPNLDPIAAKIVVIVPKHLGAEVRAAIQELLTARGERWEAVHIA